MFLLAPAHPGFPGQIPQRRKTVVVCKYMSKYIKLNAQQKTQNLVCQMIRNNVTITE